MDVVRDSFACSADTVPSAFPLGRVTVGVWRRRDRLTVWQQLTCVVEEDDVVAEEAPSLLGMGSNDPGERVIRCIGARASGLVLAHDLRLREDDVATPSPVQSRNRTIGLHRGKYLSQPTRSWRRYPVVP